MNTRNIYEILLCYEEKPIRCEKTKPQTTTVIMLWCWSLLSCPELYCDWSIHNQHSCKFSGVHGFLSLTVIDNCFHNYLDNLCNYDVYFNRRFHRTIAVWPLPSNIWQYCTENRYDYHLLLLVTTYSEISLYLFNPLSPKSDQHQISPCNINAFVKQSGHENYGHDHTRWLCLIFYQLLPSPSVGNESGRQMRIPILILGFK